MSTFATEGGHKKGHDRRLASCGRRLVLIITIMGLTSSLL